jgi:hypothetical protein
LLGLSAFTCFNSHSLMVVEHSCECSHMLPFTHQVFPRRPLPTLVFRATADANGEQYMLDRVGIKRFAIMQTRGTTITFIE